MIYDFVIFEEDGEVKFLILLIIGFLIEWYLCRRWCIWAMCRVDEIYPEIDELETSIENSKL